MRAAALPRAAAVLVAWAGAALLVGQPALAREDGAARVVAVARASAVSPEALTAAVRAAGWAASQLSSGRVEGQFGPDHGLTADVVLALAAAGTPDATLRPAVRWLEGQARAYVDGGYPGDVAAGAAAKLALVEQATGGDPRRASGRDLVALLLRQADAGGRVHDRLTYGGPDVVDLANSFTQSLAIFVLKAAGEPRVAAFADALVASGCRDGGYPVFYPVVPDGCGSDADGTGLAVQALVTAGRADEAQAGARWLLRHQARDGSFSSGGPGGVPNTNSTALAVQALAATGHADAADAGRRWLTGRQVPCAGPRDQRGAIGYSEASVDAATLRATAQAVPALVGLTYGDLTAGTATVVGSPPACDEHPPGTPAPSPSQPGPTSGSRTPDGAGATPPPPSLPAGPRSPRVTRSPARTAAPVRTRRVPQLPERHPMRHAPDAGPAALTPAPGAGSASPAVSSAGTAPVDANPLGGAARPVTTLAAAPIAAPADLTGGARSGAGWRGGVLVLGVLAFVGALAGWLAVVRRGRPSDGRS